MGKASENRPDWVRSSGEKVEQIKQHLEVVRQEGRAEIKRGLEKAKLARDLEQEIDYVGHVVLQHLPGEIWSDEIAAMSGVQLDGTLDYYQRETAQLAGMIREVAPSAEEHHECIIGILSNTISPSGSAVYLGAAIEHRFQAISPQYKPQYPVDMPARIGSRQELLKRLRVQLADYDGGFAHILDGSEEALKREDPDHLSQAAHSMRDLFQQLIEYLAPSAVVKRQPWFDPTPGAPGGVSRRSRLRYILYGSGKHFDKETISELDMLASNAKDALDLAMARAHDHDPSLTKGEVELAVDHARFYLSEVLRRSKSLGGTSPAYV
jgi:hypothetical protein